MGFSGPRVRKTGLRTSIHLPGPAAASVATQAAVGWLDGWTIADYTPESAISMGKYGLPAGHVVTIIHPPGPVRSPPRGLRIGWHGWIIASEQFCHFLKRRTEDYQTDRRFMRMADRHAWH